MRVFVRIMAIILIAIPAGVVFADIPRQISYQGFVTDNNDQPLNQLGTQVEFKIFDVPANGSPLWSEGPVAKDITNGALEHYLGSVNPLPDTLFTRFPEIWLEIVVEGEVIAPRTKLAATPYSFRVSTIDSALGGTITGPLSIQGESGVANLEVFNLGGGGAGNFQVYDATSNESALRVESNGLGPVVRVLHDLAGGDAIHAAGKVIVQDAFFNNRILVEPSAGPSFGSRMTLLNNALDATVSFIGDSSGAGMITIRDSSVERIVLDANNSGPIGGSDLTMFDNLGDPGVFIDAQDDDGGGGSAMKLYSGNGNDGIVLDAHQGSIGSAVVELYNSGGVPTVILDADVSGDGRVTTEVLEITGGADLSEQFDILPGTVDAVEPGMVLSIDPDRVGYLRISESAYDATVAGIVSGAGGVKTGMLMGQTGSVADGKHAVALSGRVWCKADASYGKISPGDLLTTSNTPGHAMKASDIQRMHGALLGKAMSSLVSGTGLVLVLVSLQ
jgi:hypothetical protein